jgi:hypothetical protein
MSRNLGAAGLKVSEHPGRFVLESFSPFAQIMMSDVAAAVLMDMMISGCTKISLKSVLASHTTRA